ncbi:hypothetical protein ACHAWF_003561 [Thalassiosira exigua]
MMTRPPRRLGGEGSPFWLVFLGMLAALAWFDIVKFHSTINSAPPDIDGVKRSGPGLERRLWAGDSNSIICPSALELFDDSTELEMAIADNIVFHQRGGNTRSIERYLNSHMQYTLDIHGIEFTPKGEDRPKRDAISYLREYYLNHKVRKGGYGQPLPGNFASKYGNELLGRSLFEKRWINVVEPVRHERYAASMGPVGPSCTNKVVFWKGTHEEKFLCAPAIQKGRSTVEGECNILSIGSNDEWGFETDVLRKLPGCKTHTFDCTLGENGPRKKPDNDNAQFYPYCIGSDNARPEYLPYERILNTTGSKVPPKFLKMDVEGFEYDVLHALLSSDPSVLPEQIALEVHWATRMVDVPWMMRTRTAAEIAMFFGGLFNRGGYIVTNVKIFDGCYPCSEVLLVRAVCPSRGASSILGDVVTKRGAGA